MFKISFILELIKLPYYVARLQCARSFSGPVKETHFIYCAIAQILRFCNSENIIEEEDLAILKILLERNFLHMSHKAHEVIRIIN